MNLDNNEISKFSRSDEVTKRLLELIEKYNYQLVQENGQRRLTSVNTDPRIKGAEIFLGRLPRDCYEDELVPVLMKIGNVMELRLMMDFSGSTRGYAFASFENSRTARRACEELNGHEIRPGHKIGVVKSIDNCRLFLGGVPKDKTKNDFMKELGKMLDGITNIYVYPSTEDKTLNRGFVFVEFKDHRSAAMARRKLIPGRVMLWDHEVAVDWADPEPGQDIDDEIMETVSALFLRNLSLTATESEIRHIIQRLTSVQIMKIKKINHFAFLHYETRAQAQKVLDIMKQSCGNNELTSEWELTWAKPIRKSEKLQERLRCVKTNNNNNNNNQDENNRGVNHNNNNNNNNNHNNNNCHQNRKNQFTNNNNNNNNNNKEIKKNNNIDKYRDNRNNITSAAAAGTPDLFTIIDSSSTIAVSVTANNNDDNNHNDHNNDKNNKSKIVIPNFDSKIQMMNYNLYNGREITDMITINNNGEQFNNNLSTIAGNREYNLLYNNCNNNNNIMDNEYRIMQIPRSNHDATAATAVSSIISYPMNDDLQLAEYAKALGEVAAKRFQANLRYEYWSNEIGTEFYCKIILEKNGCELMSYQGNPAPAMHEAIRLTVPNAYATMQLMLMHGNKY